MNLADELTNGGRGSQAEVEIQPVMNAEDLQRGLRKAAG